MLLQSSLGGHTALQHLCPADEFECLKSVCDLIAISVSDFKRFKPSHSAIDFMAVAARLCSGMALVGRETCQIDNPGPKAHEISGHVDGRAR